MATEKVIELEAKCPPPAAQMEKKRRPPKEGSPTTAEEARAAAKQVVFQSAAAMARELIAKSGGNYLTVKFLFEFAGLAGGDAESASEPSPLLRYYLEGLRNTRQVSSEANKDAKTESVL